MHPYIKLLQEQFRLHADPAIAAGQEAYMRHQFAFMGIKTPLRRRLTITWYKQSLPLPEELPAIVKAMWGLPEREFQYAAIELVAAMKKQWSVSLIKLVEYMITHKSWWDSVDAINTVITGPYFLQYPEQIPAVTGKWNTSGNIWLQRSSLMFQKSYKLKTDTALLSKYILHLASSEEFFIQKAIGWALREYAKVKPAWVKQFVKQHALAPLSKREALKHC